MGGGKTREVIYGWESRDCGNGKSRKTVLSVATTTTLFWCPSQFTHIFPLIFFDCPASFQTRMFSGIQYSTALLCKKVQHRAVCFVEKKKKSGRFGDRHRKASPPLSVLFYAGCQTKFSRKAALALSSQSKFRFWGGAQSRFTLRCVALRC